MRVGSPCSESSMEGTAARGARSEKAEIVRWRPLTGRRAFGGGGGGEELGTRVEEVGSGVGKNCFPFSRPCLCGDAWDRRFAGRGRTGEEDWDGSKVNGGRSEGAGRFWPAMGEVAKGAWRGDTPIVLVALCRSCKKREQHGVLILRAGEDNNDLGSAMHDQLMSGAVQQSYREIYWYGSQQLLEKEERESAAVKEHGLFRGWID